MVTQGILLSIFSCCSLYVWLIDGQFFTNTEKNRLINSVCFRVQSVKKKGKVHKGKRSAWHMKIISKLKYQYADTKINLRDITTRMQLYFTQLFTFHSLYFLPLTHYSPVMLFYTPWKHQKTFRFSVFRGIEKQYRIVMG